MTRAFVAIRPPDVVLDEVASIEIGVGRPTTRAQWHITLQFLGDVADIDAIGAALAGVEVVAGPAQLGGLGAFPREQRARVVWLGLVQGEALFGALARAVNERLAPLGFRPDDRTFHPHLTLARLKAPSDVRRDLERRPVAAVGEPWMVDEVRVYSSELRPDGARHTVRAAIPLRDA